jgi:hypothetical protein
MEAFGIFILLGITAFISWNSRITGTLLAFVVFMAIAIAILCASSYGYELFASSQEPVYTPMQLKSIGLEFPSAFYCANKLGSTPLTSYLYAV